MKEWTYAWLLLDESFFLMLLKEIMVLTQARTV
jgi:hypothetical protein